VEKEKDEGQMDFNFPSEIKGLTFLIEQKNAAKKTGRLRNEISKNKNIWKMGKGRYSRNMAQKIKVCTSASCFVT
jgi:hypothetical protein